ncbi:hypothetical protein FQR65_LT11081 [Abscondita terminalis]|nr:hypothetical protein FQR65_LT11081 [Abscondita terminalis]
MELPVVNDVHITRNDSVCETPQKTVLLQVTSSYMENGEDKMIAPLIFVEHSEGADIPSNEQDVIDEEETKAKEIGTNSSISNESDDEGNRSDEQKDGNYSKSPKNKKSVSFNRSLTKEIDIDFRELGFNNWNGVPTLTKEEVLSAYQTICNESKADAEDEIISQLSGVQNNSNFSMMLNLLDVSITSDKLDIYEKLFQIMNFHKLYVNVDLLENEALVEIFHMIEYYNSTKELILYGNYVSDSGLWASIAVAASNCNNNLNKISIHELRITDGGLMSIFNSINENPHIKVLRFNGCKLNFTPTFSIATPLKNNRFLKELHLCNAELYYKETTILALFLRDNYSLKVLNLSNNKLGDRGFKVLVKALVEQSRDDIGISVLMVANNRLTKAIAPSVETLLKNCPLMHSINVGCNNLTDELIVEIKESLEACVTLKALGLQSTLLTNEGVLPLMQVCTTNEMLQYLNLRGNRALQHDALQTIVTHLPHTHLKYIELDEANRFCTDAQEYVQILNNIRKLLIIKSSNDSSLSEKYNFTPAMALSCDIDYVPRCLTWRTPRNRGRFEVVSVPESNFASTTTTQLTRDTGNSSTTISSSVDVAISKELVNWSPAYSSYSQKTNWAKMKLLESDDGGKKSKENGVNEKSLDIDTNNSLPSDSVEFSDLGASVQSLNDDDNVTSVSVNNNRDVVSEYENEKDKNSDHDSNTTSIVSIGSCEVVIEEQHEKSYNSQSDELLIATSPGSEGWDQMSSQVADIADSFCNNDNVSSTCYEENQVVESKNKDNEQN